MKKEGNINEGPSWDGGAAPLILDAGVIPHSGFIKEKYTLNFGIYTTNEGIVRANISTMNNPLNKSLKNNIIRCRKFRSRSKTRRKWGPK